MVLVADFRQNAKIFVLNLSSNGSPSMQKKRDLQKFSLNLYEFQ